MARIISCVNQKGGVGKTTLCVNVADALARKRQRVLVLDLDPQGHLSQCLGVREKSSTGMYSVVQSESSIRDASITLGDYLTLVPPGDKLIRLESVQMKAGRGLRVRRAIAEVTRDFDFVLMDCPPSNGFLVVNAIAASSELLIPVTPDYLGLSGLSEMMHQIRRYEDVMGKFSQLWFVVSRYQKRKVSDEAVNKIKHYLGDRVTTQVITEKAVVAECPGHGKPVSSYAPRSNSRKEFDNLAAQILEGGVQ